MENLEKLKTTTANIKINWQKILSEPKLKVNIGKIRTEFNLSRDRFSKSKIKEIRRNLYKIENKINHFSTKEIKEIKKNLLELEDLFKSKKVSCLWWYLIQRNKRYQKFIWSVNWWKISWTNKNQWCF